MKAERLGGEISITIPQILLLSARSIRFFLKGIVLGEAKISFQGGVNCFNQISPGGTWGGPKAEPSEVHVWTV